MTRLSVKLYAAKKKRERLEHNVNLLSLELSLGVLPRRALLAIFELCEEQLSALETLTGGTTGATVETQCISERLEGYRIRIDQATLQQKQERPSLRLVKPVDCEGEA